MMVLPDGAWFILGCQRSGTTLMRLILDSHQHLHCVDETLGHEILSGRAELPQTSKLLGFKLPRFTEQIDAIAPADYFVYTATRFYSGQKIIFVRRDPRDVVTSMLRLNDGEWFKRWVRSILDEKCKSSAFLSRYGPLREWCERSERPDAAVAALYWRYKNDALPGYLARGYPVHLLQYERLVSNPTSEVRAIADFLGVEWQPDRLLAHFSVEHDELMPDGKAIGGTDPHRPIDGSSVGVWMDVLDSRAAQLVEHVAYCEIR